MTEELMASIMRGLEDSAAGRLIDLGNFTQYISEEE